MSEVHQNANKQNELLELETECGETGETKNFLRPQSTERCNDCLEIMG